MATKRFASFYSKSFERRPWLTLALANASLSVLADSLAQGFERLNDNERGSVGSNSSSSSSLQLTDGGQLVEEKANAKAVQGWDWARSTRFLAFGMGMAPLLAEWNKWIEHRFPLRQRSLPASPSTVSSLASKPSDIPSKMIGIGKVSLRALGKRVAVDQILFAPFGLVLFTGAMGLMEGKDSEQLKSKFSEMYFPALLANWKIWPAIQLINFRYMPLKYRVPFTSSCGVLWTLYLSLLNTARGSANRVEQATIKEVVNSSA